MPVVRLAILTGLSLLAFAGNSLLCRLALKQSAIDPASFTTLRLVAGALTLWLLARTRRDAVGAGNWRSALALFAYAACFSYAYVSLPAGSGALLLFGAVQATMIGIGLWMGERLLPLQGVGLLCAFGGLVGLVLPGISAPPLLGSLSMVCAGIAWGLYSLRGRGAGDALRVTAGNFLRAIPIALVLSAVMGSHASIDARGAMLAIASGAITSGIGYAIWYTALPALKATQAASLQLSVPVIAALGGIVLLGEPMTWRFVFAALAILGGIALVIAGRQKSIR